MNRTGGLPPIFIELSVALVPSAALPQLLLPLATNTTPPPPEPTMAPNRAGRLPTILAIFTAARSLLSLRRIR